MKSLIHIKYASGVQAPLCSFSGSDLGRWLHTCTTPSVPISLSAAVVMKLTNFTRY